MTIEKKNIYINIIPDIICKWDKSKLSDGLSSLKLHPELAI